MLSQNIAGCFNVQLSIILSVPASGTPVALQPLRLVEVEIALAELSAESPAVVVVECAVPHL